MRGEGSEFRVYGLGSRVEGSGFRVQGLGFKLQGLGFTSPIEVSCARIPVMATGRLALSGREDSGEKAVAAVSNDSTARHCAAACILPGLSCKMAFGSGVGLPLGVAWV